MCYPQIHFFRHKIIIVGEVDENENSHSNIVRFILKTVKEYKYENNRIDTSMSFGSYEEEA